ncbi:MULTISPECIES: hypothetical protein [Psychrobacter]|uniref:hypothetical protein n=1 Tax=Psychrobacter TaxID=497 RepID=UPI0019194B02|nr:MULTISPECIES: hypothetical protein [Psychrobacter]
MKRSTLSLFLVITLSLFQIGCMQQEKKQDPYKEGDIVTWLLWGEMIIKAEIGERRTHSLENHSKRGESEFYRPHAEHYLGQFPIDYQPKAFDTISKEETLAMPVTPIMPGQALEFNLMLNGSWVQASDRSVVSDETLDHPDQVKVIVNNYSLGGNTKQSFDNYSMLELDADSTETNNGVTCYRFKGEKGEYNHKKCFGQSENSLISGYEIYIPITKQVPMFVEYRESIYNGVKVNWYADRKNLAQAQAIDAAIWRLLDTWSISSIE